MGLKNATQSPSFMFSQFCQPGSILTEQCDVVFGPAGGGVGARDGDGYWAVIAGGALTAAAAAAVPTQLPVVVATPAVQAAVFCKQNNATLFWGYSFLLKFTFLDVLW